MSNCHPLKVVGRGSDPQLQVGGNLNGITWRRRGYFPGSNEYHQISLKCHNYDVLQQKTVEKYLILTRHGGGVVQGGSLQNPPHNFAQWTPTCSQSAFLRNHVTHPP